MISVIPMMKSENSSSNREEYDSLSENNPSHRGEDDVPLPVQSSLPSLSNAYSSVDTVFQCKTPISREEELYSKIYVHPGRIIVVFGY